MWCNIRPNLHDVWCEYDIWLPFQGGDQYGDYFNQESKCNKCKFRVAGPPPIFKGTSTVPDYTNAYMKTVE